MELFAADGHDAGGCERVTGKSGMRPRDVRGREDAWDDAERETYTLNTARDRDKDGRTCEA